MMTDMNWISETESGTRVRRIDPTPIDERPDRWDMTPLARGDYEVLCRSIGTTPLPDGAIATSYGIRFFDSGAAADPSAWNAFRYQIHRRRQMALDAEARARQASRPAPETAMAVCGRCGTEIPRSLLMSASLGTVCPDCYDEWSD